VLGELARAEAEAGLADDAPRTLEAAASLLEREGAASEAIAQLIYTVVVTFTLAFTAVPQNLGAIEPLMARALAAVEQSRSLTWACLKLMDRYIRPEAFGPVRTLRPVRLIPRLCGSFAARVPRQTTPSRSTAWTPRSARKSSS